MTDTKVKFQLMDNSKPLSENNKIIANTMEFIHVCDCGKETSLTDKFTDNLPTGGCGWFYRCSCGKTHELWEGAFDNQIAYLYENDLIINEEE